MLNYAFGCLYMGNWASVGNKNVQHNAPLSCPFLPVGVCLAPVFWRQYPFCLQVQSKALLVIAFWGTLESKFQCGVCVSRRPKPGVLEELGGYAAASGSPDKNPVFIWTWHKKRSAECPFYGVQRAAPFGRCVVVYNNYHPAPKNPLNNG